MLLDDKKFISEQVKVHRKILKLTQAELAEKVGLSVQHISKIESGHYIPSLKTFFMLVDVLKIDLAVFGINISKNNNEIKDVLIEKIIKADDRKLIFYHNLINAIDESLANL